MSKLKFSKIDNRLIESGIVKTLSRAALKVYLVLNMRRNHETGVCFPSYNSLQKDTGLARSGVWNGINELDVIGAIKVSGEGDFNVYTVLTVDEWFQNNTSIIDELVLKQYSTSIIREPLKRSKDNETSIKIELALVLKKNQGSTKKEPLVVLKKNPNYTKGTKRTDKTNLTKRNKSGTNVPRAQKNINDQNTEVEDGKCKDKRSIGSCPTKSGPDHTVNSRSIGGDRSSVKNSDTANYKISNREPSTPRAKQHNNIIPNPEAVTFPAAGGEKEVLSDGREARSPTGSFGNIDRGDCDSDSSNVLGSCRTRGEDNSQPTENNISDGGEVNGHYEDRECQPINRAVERSNKDIESGGDSVDIKSYDRYPNGNIPEVGVFTARNGENLKRNRETVDNGGDEIDEELERTDLGHGNKGGGSISGGEPIAPSKYGRGCEDQSTNSVGARNSGGCSCSDCRESREGECDFQENIGGDLRAKGGGVNTNEETNIKSASRVRGSMGNSTASDNGATPLREVFDPEKHDMGVGDSCMGGGADNGALVRRESKRGHTATGRHGQGKGMENRKIFETEFWPIYPKRNGRRLGKATAQEWFEKNIKPEDVQNVIIATKNYAASGEIPRDPVRFLAGKIRGKDWDWRDWVEVVENKGGDSEGHNRNSGFNNKNTKKNKPRLESGLKKCLRNM